MTARDVECLVRRFYERLWNSWDDDAVDTTLAEDFRFRGSLGQETRGRDEWRAYRDMIRAGSADFHNELIELVTEPGRAAARLRYQGHHSGMLLGLPGSGRPFAYDGAAFFTIRECRLAGAWVLGDLDSLRRQLQAAGPA